LKPGTHHTEAARRAIGDANRGRERGPDTWAHHLARCAAQQARRRREEAAGERRWGGRVVKVRTGGKV